MMAQACRKIRRRLSAFRDGELPVGEQIAVQAHVRECPACAAEMRELDELGSCLRAGALATEFQPEELEGLPSAVISRMKAEDAESISGRTGRLFEDLHLVWAALGATGATVACVAVIYLISWFAILPPAGYNKNPAVPNAAMNLPSASLNTSFPSEPPVDEGDLVLLVDAVVSRDGRVDQVRADSAGRRGEGADEGRSAGGARAARHHGEDPVPAGPLRRLPGAGRGEHGLALREPDREGQDAGAADSRSDRCDPAFRCSGKPDRRPARLI